MTSNSDSLPALQADRVWFVYRSRDWVLRDVSLSIEPGELTRSDATRLRAAAVASGRAAA